MGSDSKGGQPTRFAVGAIERYFWAGRGDPHRTTPAVEIFWRQAPDDARIVDAIRKLLIEQPLLGSRLVIRGASCWWEPTAPEPAGFLRPVERLAGGAIAGPAGLEARLRTLRNRMLAMRYDALDGATWCIHRARSPDGREWWLVPIHEMISDAHGWLQVLDSLFAHLSDPTRPALPQLGSRDLLEFAKWNGHGLGRIPEDYTRLRGPWPRPDESGERRHAFVHLDRERFADLRDAGRRSGASVNDLLHFAMLRALERAGGLECERGGERFLRLGVLMDLRQLAPIPSGLASFIGFGFVTLPVPLPADGRALMLELVRQRAALVDPSWLVWQARRAPLSRFVPLPVLARFNRWFLGSPTGVSANVSNVGDLTPRLPHVGPDVEHVQLTGFVHPTVPLVLGASSFRGTLSLATGAVSGVVGKERLRSVMKSVVETLEHLEHRVAASCSTCHRSG